MPVELAHKGRLCHNGLHILIGSITVVWKGSLANTYQPKLEISGLGFRSNFHFTFINQICIMIVLSTNITHNFFQRYNNKKWPLSNSISHASKMIPATQNKKNFWNPLRETWNNSNYPLGEVHKLCCWRNMSEMYRLDILDIC